MTAALDTRIQENSALAAGGPTSAPPGWRWSSAGLRVGANDPSPLSDAASFWRLMSQVATIAMATIMIGVCLYFARPLVVPILGALVVSLTIGPLAGYAIKARPASFRSGAGDRRDYRRDGLCHDPAAGRSGVRTDRPGARNRREDQGQVHFHGAAACRDPRFARRVDGRGIGEGGRERADRSDRQRARHRDAGAAAIRAVLRHAVLLRVRPRRHAPVGRQPVRQPRRPPARAEDLQRHRAQPERLPDHRHDHQCLRRSGGDRRHLVARLSGAAALGRAGLHAELHPVCRARASCTRSCS